MRRAGPLLMFVLAACATEATSSEANPPALPPASGTGEVPGETPPDPKPDATAMPAKAKGCSVAPAAGGTFAEKTVMLGGVARTYHLAVPTGLVMGKAAPLLFVLHPAGDENPENMRDWFAVESKLAGAIAVYPQALKRTRSDGSGGNIPRWDVDGKEDLAFFDAILASTKDAYCIEPAKTFLTGFSSGGNMSQQLACLRQKDIGAMAVVAGPGPFVDTCDGPITAWMTHDVDDKALPVGGARSSRDFWLEQDGCDRAKTTPVAGRPECKRYDACTSKRSLVYCETSGVGHDEPAFAVDAIGAFLSGL